MRNLGYPISLDLALMLFRETNEMFFPNAWNLSISNEDQGRGRLRRQFDGWEDNYVSEFCLRTI